MANKKPGKWCFSVETFELEPILDEKVEFSGTLLTYEDSNWKKLEFTSFEQVEKRKREGIPTWVHLCGTWPDELLEKFTKLLNLNDEKRELLMSADQFSQAKDYTNNFLWSLNRATLIPVTGEIELQYSMETICFYLDKSLLLTRQGSEEHCFEELISQILEMNAIDRMKEIDEVAASAINDCLSSHGELLSIGGSRLGKTQGRVLRKPSKNELLKINVAQQIVWTQLQNVWPFEYVIETLSTSKNPIISDEGHVDFDNVRRRAEYIASLYESYREVTYDLLDLYSTAVSLRINESTIVLTIVATLFLPPTLIAGIYGMNFNNIPELNFPYSYPICLVLMLTISVSMLVWMKRKGYIELRND